jgi:hypothetical protein
MDPDLITLGVWGSMTMDWRWTLLPYFSFNAVGWSGKDKNILADGMTCMGFARNMPESAEFFSCYEARRIICGVPATSSGSGGIYPGG